MERKIKICAGYNGDTHEAYIYKNINGKKYCKSCAYKLSPPKPIRKISEKGFKIKLKKKEQYEEDIKFYDNLWNKKYYSMGILSDPMENVLIQ